MSALAVFAFGVISCLVVFNLSRGLSAKDRNRWLIFTFLFPVFAMPAFFTRGRKAPLQYLGLFVGSIFCWLLVTGFVGMLVDPQSFESSELPESREGAKQDASAKAQISKLKNLTVKKEETQSPVSAWEYSQSVDELSGKSAYNAQVRSSNFQSFGFPYNGETHGTLSLRKHPRYGKDLIFQVDQGQILCRSYSGCPISIRFDEGAVITVEGNPPEDNSSDTVFLPYSRFIKKIQKSKKIVIGMPVYQEGEPAFIFDTQYLKWKE
jgi:hypothetical protein